MKNLRFLSKLGPCSTQRGLERRWASVALALGSIVLSAVVVPSLAFAEGNSSRFSASIEGNGHAAEVTSQTDGTATKWSLEIDGVDVPVDSEADVRRELHARGLELDLDFAQRTPRGFGQQTPLSVDADRSGYLGVMIAPVPPELRAHLGLAPKVGALVRQVAEDSPAGAAGIEEHDVILSLDGKPVDAASLAQRLSARSADDDVELELIHRGVRLTARAKLSAQRPRLLSGGFSNHLLDGFDSQRGFPPSLRRLLDLRAEPPPLPPSL